MVAMALAAHKPIPMEFVNIGDRYAESGSPESLLEKYGLTAEDVVAAAGRAIARK
jgi:transketolase